MSKEVVQTLKKNNLCIRPLNCYAVKKGSSVKKEIVEGSGGFYS